MEKIFILLFLVVLVLVIGATFPVIGDALMFAIESLYEVGQAMQ